MPRWGGYGDILEVRAPGAEWWVWCEIWVGRSYPASPLVTNQ